LREHIGKDTFEAAQRVGLTIIETVEAHLPENPQLGAPGRVPGTRELLVPNTPVIVPYRLRSGAVEILGVFHHSRRWPDRL
jgi:toxin ParE1/3/4